MCSLDLEPCDVWNEEPRVMATATYKGRPHECDGCGSIIARGDAYLRGSYLFEREWSTERVCFLCWVTRERFAEEHEGMRCMASGLSTELRECISENYADRPGDEKKRDPWRPLLAALLKRRRMTRKGRVFWHQDKETQRRHRGRTSWALGPGGIPRSEA